MPIILVNRLSRVWWFRSSVREARERKATRLHQILCEVEENVYWNFSDVTKSFEDECLSRSKCHKWFKEGRVSIADDPRSGRLTGVSTDDVHVSQDKLPCAFESTSNHLRNDRRMQHLIWFKPRNLKKKTAHASSGEMMLWEKRD